MAVLTEAWRAGRADVTARRTRSTPVLAAVVKRVARALPTVRRARRAILTVGGLGMLDYAAWGWHHLVGYAAAGVSLLLLDWLSGDAR